MYLSFLPHHENLICSREGEELCYLKYMTLKGLLFLEFVAGGQMKSCTGQALRLSLISSCPRGSKYRFLTLVPFPLAYSDLILRAKENAELGLAKIGIYLPGVSSFYKLMLVLVF